MRRGFIVKSKVIENVLSAALSKGGDFAEIFVEDKLCTNIRLVGGLIENNISGRDYGVGIRIFDKLNCIYAYTNDSSEENLIKVAKEAAAALNSATTDLTLNFLKGSPRDINPIKIIPSTVDKKKKVDLMKRAYEVAKNYDASISQVSINYLDDDQRVLIANTEGVMAEDRRVRTRFSVASVASKNGEMQQGFYGPGASMGFEFFEKINVEEVAREASRIANTMIDAEHCPSWVMPVIMDNEFGGVLFHEACGHGLEAAFVSKGTSVFANKLGQQVASSLVTAIDDGTIPNGWGSTNIDDEGTPTQKNVLIENGILKSYLIDKLNGRRMEWTLLVQEEDNPTSLLLLLE